MRNTLADPLRNYVTLDLDPFAQNIEKGKFRYFKNIWGKSANRGKL